MEKNVFKLSKPVAWLLALTIIIAGASFMIVNADTGEEKQGREVFESSDFSTKRLGIDLLDSQKSLSVSLTPALSFGLSLSGDGSENDYYGANGSLVGKQIVCTEEGGCSVYSAKDEASESLAYVPMYACLTFISTDGEWCEVSSDAASGFVKADCFAYGKDAEALEASMFRDVAVPSEDGIYLFASDDTASDIICLLPAGYSYEYIKAEIGDEGEPSYDDELWYCVNVENVGTGYILKRQADISEEKISAVSQANRQNFLTKLSEGLSNAAAQQSQRDEYYGAGEGDDVYDETDEFFAIKALRFKASGGSEEETSEEETEEQTEEQTEETTGAQTEETSEETSAEPATEPAAEETAQAYTEPETEAYTEPATEAYTEPATQEQTETVQVQQGSGYRSVYISGYGSYKSYERYTALRNTASWQYKLQQMAYTGNHGMRMYDGRYCIAVGSGVGASGGQYVDLVLENGTVIPCVIGDFKADSDTDSANFATGNGCVSEFIVDMDALDWLVRVSGNASNAESSWNSPVVEYRVYDRYAF